MDLSQVRLALFWVHAAGSVTTKVSVLPDHRLLCWSSCIKFLRRKSNNSSTKECWSSARLLLPFLSIQLSSAE